MNWQTILTDYWRQILGGLGLAGAGVYEFWPTISKWQWPSTAEDSNDAADVAAMRRLQARFVRLKCPEGTQALQVVGQHFFHEGTDAPH